MTENKVLIREYTIPLRRHWLNVPKYERTSKAIKAIKKFIAKHMKVPERDIEKVKLDVYFNNELWFRGRAKPPAKIKVRAIKEGDVVKVNFFDIPERIKFLKARHEKLHKKPEEKKQEKQDEKKESEKIGEERERKGESKIETEKEKAVEELNIKQAEKAAHTNKHTTKIEKAQHPQRMALKK